MIRGLVDDGKEAARNNPLADNPISGNGRRRGRMVGSIACTEFIHDCRAINIQSSWICLRRFRNIYYVGNRSTSNLENIGVHDVEDILPNAVSQ